MCKKDIERALCQCMEEFSFPCEARESFLAAHDAVFANQEYANYIKSICEAYRSNKEIDLTPILAFAEKAAAAVGCHVYTVQMLILLYLAEESRGHFAAEGLSDRLWHDSFADLSYKLTECKLVKGVWGTFVADWFERFYKVERFAFGLLQFEISSLWEDVVLDGIAFPKGTPTVQIHLPRTGKRLSPEAFDASLADGCAFMKKKYGLTHVIIACYSWLLYDYEGQPLFTEGSNLHAFRSRFTLLRNDTHLDGHPDLWRLFDRDYTGDVEALPADSSLRRAMKAYVQGGGKTGEGYGTFLVE